MVLERNYKRLRFLGGGEGGTRDCGMKGYYIHFREAAHMVESSILLIGLRMGAYKWLNEHLWVVCKIIMCLVTPFVLNKRF